MVNKHVEFAAEESGSKRNAILRAAYKVFSNKGYERATLDEIILLANTGKGTVYNHFGNKEQLFYTLVQERSKVFEIALEKLVDSPQQALAKLETMVGLFVDFYAENANLWRVLIHEIGAFSEGVKPETREKYRSLFIHIVNYLEKPLEEGISQGVLRQYDVNKLAFSLFYFIITLVFADLVEQDTLATTHEIIDIFMNGMGINPPSNWS